MPHALLHTARAPTDLADRVGTGQQHRDALVRSDPEKYKRVHALTHVGLGDGLAARARADEAVAAWSQALTLMEGMASDRTRKAIASLRSTLSLHQRRKVPGTAELARRAHEAPAQAATVRPTKGHKPWPSGQPTTGPKPCRPLSIP